MSYSIILLKNTPNGAIETAYANGTDRVALIRDFLTKYCDVMPLHPEDLIDVAHEIEETLLDECD